MFVRRYVETSSRKTGTDKRLHVCCNNFWRNGFCTSVLSNNMVLEQKNGGKTCFRTK
jgi:hypothetical protein